MSDNTITIAGNMTADPVIRFSGAGKAILSGSVAVNRRWQQNGEWIEQVSFIGWKAFGQIAENIAASCVKGTRVLLTGRLETGEYTDKAGVERKTVDIIVDDFGTSLKFATVQVERTVRDSTGHKPALDIEEPF